MVNNKEVGQEVNAEKTKCVFMFHHQNAGQNSSIRTCLIMQITNI